MNKKLSENGIRRSLRLLLCVICLAALLFSSAAAYAATPGSSPEKIHVRCVTAGAMDIEWDFPYDDALFLADPSEFSHTLAQASMGLALSSVRSSKYAFSEQNTTVKTFLEDAGFSSIAFEQYDIEPRVDTVATAIGSKKLGDSTLIALVTCGDGYGKEWGSNLMIGSGVRHKGFDEAARKVESRLEDYIRSNGITGDMKLWISGWSRAAAVDNLVAADMLDSGIFSGVYAYFFACPANTREPKEYPCIFNILGKNDPITMIPLADWGFGRNGINLYLTAEQFDSCWYEGAIGASYAGLELDDSLYRNNPELDYDFRTLFELLLGVFPSSESYAKELEDIAVSVFNETDNTNLPVLILKSVKEWSSSPGAALSDEAAERSEMLDLLFDFTASVSAKYLKHNDSQTADGSWQTELRPDANLFHEHSSEIYIEWMFADIPDAVRYGTGTEFIRLIAVGPVSATVAYENDRICAELGSDGKLVYPAEASYDTSLPTPYAVRKNGQTVIDIPLDREYNIILDSKQAAPVEVDIIERGLSETSSRSMTELKGELGRGRALLIPINYDADGRLAVNYDAISDGLILCSTRGGRRMALKLESRNFSPVSAATIMKTVFALMLFVALSVLLSLAQLVYRLVTGKKAPPHARKLSLYLLIAAAVLALAVSLFCVLL